MLHLSGRLQTRVLPMLSTTKAPAAKARVEATPSVATARSSHVEFVAAQSILHTCVLRHRARAAANQVPVTVHFLLRSMLLLRNLLLLLCRTILCSTLITHSRVLSPDTAISSSLMAGVRCSRLQAQVLQVPLPATASPRCQRYRLMPLCLIAMLKLLRNAKLLRASLMPLMLFQSHSTHSLLRSFVCVSVSM